MFNRRKRVLGEEDRLGVAIYNRGYNKPASINVADQTVTWQRGNFTLTLELFQNKRGEWMVAFTDDDDNRWVVLPQWVDQILQDLDELDMKMKSRFRWSAEALDV